MAAQTQAMRSELWPTSFAPHLMDGLLVDLDGVVWRGEDPIDGASEALLAIRATGVRVLFLTNEPGRSRGAVALRLCSMGVAASADDVVTASTAAARVVGSLEGLIARRALVIGPAALKSEIHAVGFELVRHEQAVSAEIVVVGGHPDFNYHELSAATLAIRNGACLFATGRDAVFPTSDGLQPGTGAILAAVEAAGGSAAVVVGKPEAPIFKMALEAMMGTVRVCVVGDHLAADIAGGKNAGLATILVLTGVSQRGDLANSAVQPDLVLESIADLPDLLQRSS